MNQDSDAFPSLFELAFSTLLRALGGPGLAADLDLGRLPEEVVLALFVVREGVPGVAAAAYQVAPAWWGAWRACRGP